MKLRQRADDNGGVHINSRIPNRAFCQAATNIGGFAWTVTGRIWYRTLTAKLSPKGSSRISPTPRLLLPVSCTASASVQITIAEAWSDVGMHVRCR
jgi:Zn-dependent metalloprotease